MPSERTTVTELGTGLGMLGQEDVDEALRSRTPVMHSLSPETWQRLYELRAGRHLRRRVPCGLRQRTGVPAAPPTGSADACPG